MSGPAHKVRAEPDVLDTPRLLAIAVGTLVLFLVASLATGWGMEWWRGRLLPEGPPPLPAEVGQGKIGMVEQRLFENTRTGEDWLADQRRRLQSYGWVDRKAGIIHVPVEQGMERVLRGERP
ncbi:MAG TPA: hypothetical protein VFR85_16385 [Anaeromyxobacteraceae bacterium]|nr:hypothetical protein [Anaeromyxobacteraceae bacterium]